MTTPTGKLAKSAQSPLKKGTTKSTTGATPKKTPHARPTGAQTSLGGAEDDRALQPSIVATRHPDDVSDRARDERLAQDLAGNAAGSVADRHRHGLTATENEEDDLPQDLDDDSGEGLSEPTAPGAEDDDLSGAVTQERVERLDPDYREGRRRSAGGRAAKDG
jgi:hypothetical protein